MPDTWWGEGKAAVARDYRDRAAPPRRAAGEGAGAHPEDEGVGEQDALEAGDHRLGLQPPRRGRHGRHGAAAGRAGRGGASRHPWTRPGYAPDTPPRGPGPPPAGGARALTETAERAGGAVLCAPPPAEGAPATAVFCPRSPPVLWHPCALSPPVRGSPCPVTPCPVTPTVPCDPLSPVRVHLLSCDTPCPVTPLSSDTHCPL